MTPAAPEAARQAVGIATATRAVPDRLYTSRERIRNEGASGCDLHPCPVSPSVRAVVGVGGLAVSAFLPVSVGDRSAPAGRTRAKAARMLLEACTLSPRSDPSRVPVIVNVELGALNQLPPLLLVLGWLDAAVAGVL